MDPTKFLYPEEVKGIIDSLKKSKTIGVKRRRAVFRLSCCCGLRESEIVGVNLNDFITEGKAPVIRIRKEIAKYKKARMVPLWWDKGTFEDIRAWKEFRFSQGAKPEDPFITTKAGKRPSRMQIYRYWKSAIRSLHPERKKQLPCHAGRHTFASTALHVGRSLVEVQKALGHSSLQVTSQYAHAINTTTRDIWG